MMHRVFSTFARIPERASYACAGNLLKGHPQNSLQAIENDLCLSVCFELFVRVCMYVHVFVCVYIWDVLLSLSVRPSRFICRMTFVKGIQPNDPKI